MKNTTQLNNHQSESTAFLWWEWTLIVEQLNEGLQKMTSWVSTEVTKSYPKIPKELEALLKKVLKKLATLAPWLVKATVNAKMNLVFWWQGNFENAYTNVYDFFNNNEEAFMSIWNELVNWIDLIEWVSLERVLRNSDDLMAYLEDQKFAYDVKHIFGNIALFYREINNKNMNAVAKQIYLAIANDNKELATYFNKKFKEIWSSITPEKTLPLLSLAIVVALSGTVNENDEFTQIRKEEDDMENEISNTDEINHLMKQYNLSLSNIDYNKKTFKEGDVIMIMGDEDNIELDVNGYIVPKESKKVIWICKISKVQDDWGLTLHKLEWLWTPNTIQISINEFSSLPQQNTVILK